LSNANLASSIRKGVKFADEAVYPFRKNAKRHDAIIMEDEIVHTFHNSGNPEMVPHDIMIKKAKKKIRIERIREEVSDRF